jgi:putative inorganic carbon (HCO3(-)) transporter
MPLKGILFIGLFLLCVIGALVMPYLGVYGYIAEYCIGTSRQWWAVPFVRMGIRLSYTIALATILGTFFQWRKLRYGRLLVGQEVLILLFLGIVCLSVLTGEATIGLYTRADHPSLKFAKVVLFVLVMTHVITDVRKLDGLLWVFVVVSLVLGLKAWGTPRSAFIGGRLETIGGADFVESNFLAAFMASMLPLIGIQFLRSKWLGRAVCAVSGAFTANAIVLCRSRGAVVGIVAGILTACLFAPKKHQKKIAVAIALGIMGGIYVSDPQFLKRVSTITRNEEERDESVDSRLRAWQAGAEMISNHPLGIGIGNWYQTIGHYLPEDEGLDSHNTYIKCMAELGVQGILVYVLFIFTAFLQLRRVRKFAASLPPPVGDDLVQISFGLIVLLSILLTCGLTITMIYTEIIWILLMLPVCLRRALDNAMSDHELALTGDGGESGPKTLAQPGGHTETQ